MAKPVILAVFIVLNAFLPVTLAGTVARQHRDTTLDDFKFIDSFVSSALPVLQDGFFIGTSRGPVLVKSGPRPGDNNRPTVRSKYYNTLPRLIPAGFEGIAVSNYNLGAANPYRPLSPSKNLLTVPAQPHQYIATHATQPSEQYVSQPVVEQTQQVYQHQPQQYVAEAQQPQEYISQPQQYNINEQPQQQQFLQSEQPQQQFLQNDQPHHHQFLQSEQPQQFLQQEPSHHQQYFQRGPARHQFAHEQSQQQFPQPEQPQEQQFLQPEQSQPQQQLFQFPQYVGASSQLISEQSADSQQAAQEPEQISARSQAAAPVAEPSFQVDNLLRPEQDQNSVTAYQTQVFGRERFQSQKLLRNAAVIATQEFEDTLPETLRNRFYKNANLATILAQESLPIQGEQIIGEWDTNKIAKGKIHALLHGAGLI